MEFKPGDVVQLKSGGPQMTVADSSGGSILCIWTDKNKTFREPFPPVVLEKYQPFV